VSNVEQRIVELGLKLPELPHFGGSYKQYYQVGNLLFLSGQGPRNDQGILCKGKLGAGYETEQAVQDAQAIALQLLATAKIAIGDLDRIFGVVKILGLVNSTPDYIDQPKVIDGCSKLFTAVLGDAGNHARSALGAVSLPGGISVEIEAIFEIS
jgi:enamine deaminase RidA (YjgF/YER057c/UK114 family)